MRHDRKIYLLTSHPPAGLECVEAFMTLNGAIKAMRQGASENDLTLVPLKRTSEEDWETYPYHIRRVQLKT